MKKRLTMLALGACATALTAVAALAQGAPEITLTRLACGADRAPADMNERFSDTWSYHDLKLPFVFSCYVIKHGSDYLLWDTGFAMGTPTAAKESVVDQLAKLNIKPEQIKFVGISHYHADHTGQVSSFPQATLLIGKGDWDGIASPNPPAGANAPPFKHWVSEGGKVEPQPGDKDVFGDGTVIMLYTPGHTPGHHSLLVKLPQTGAVILSGDAAHFHENYDTSGVPGFNYDRAQTIASMDRLKKIAANMKATFIIQHDARDVAMLPAFPAAAK